MYNTTESWSVASLINLFWIDLKFIYLSKDIQYLSLATFDSRVTGVFDVIEDCVVRNMIMRY